MKYTLIEKILVQGVAFVQSVILARLLCPEDFGLAAMLGIFLGVGGILAESGLGGAYVVYGGDARKVFKWNVGVAVIIYAMLAIAAPWIAAFYRQPVLRDLMWVMGLTVIIYAASVSRTAMLQRQKRFKSISFVNTISVLAAFGASVGMASAGWRVWAIVSAGLAHGVVRLVGLFCCRVGRGEDGEQSGAWQKMLSYGWKTLVCGLIGTLYTHSFRLVIGKIFDPSAVGLFHRAQHWATLPGSVINESVSRVALPALVQRMEGSVEEGVGCRWMGVNGLLLWSGMVP